MNEIAEYKKLYRVQEGRMVAGVCGGLSEYLKVDPTVVRLAMVVLGLLGGIGVVLYGAAWILVPERFSSTP
jgi:phage shock protein PspC (stress-responsive transcriptional regulator)